MSHKLSISKSRRSRLLTGCVKTIVLVAALSFARIAVFAQETSSSSSTDSNDRFSASSASASTPDASEDSTSASSTQSSTGTSLSTLSSSPDGTLTTPSLSADQIISILEQNPDLNTEVKSQVADRLQQQGTGVDANDISDEMLYSQISNNAALRANLTVFLRAQGYVSDADIQEAAATQDSDASSSRDANSSSENTDVLQQKSRDPNESKSMSASKPGSAARSAENQKRRNGEQTNASTDAPQVVHLPAPYSLRSMRDLYTQIPDQNLPLKRFGSDVFVNRNLSSVSHGLSAGDTSLDVPLGPDYVLGPGDTLSISLWGGVTQNINRPIDREGRVLLPEAGSVPVAGLTLERAQSVITSALQQQFRNAQVAVTVTKLHSVRVFVVGDVQRPGGYDISALATPVSALYAAGGPTAAGSLRTARHMRGDRLVENIDLYDFLLHGIRNGSVHFESGDTLLVPPAGPQIAIRGSVRRPAVYEVKDASAKLSSIVEDAGGFIPSASLDHIIVERIDANHQRETLTLDVNEKQGTEAAHAAVAAFDVKDGDRIRVEPILSYSQRAVYLEGHVVRPGRISYKEGMRLNDVLRSYQDMLPEPAARGEIIRLVPPDLHAVTINFDVPDVMIGNANVDLQPFDTIRILGRYESDAPKVEIRGEVLRPGNYPMSQGMTAAQLVRMAGGLKRDALQESADLTSYEVIDGKRITEQIASIRIGAAVSGADGSADVPLKAGDILSIHQITGWKDIGESVTIGGEVRYPGSYGFQDGEHLSSVLRRAGGFLPAAYPTGAVLVRDQVRELEEKSRDQLIRQIETNSAAARLSPNLGAGDSGTTLQLIKAQQDQVLGDLKSHPPSGRMVIHISADIDSWANTPADIELRRGDVLTVPKRPGFVLVTGQVYNATALTFTPGKTVSWYLRRAGGTNSTANRKEIFVIRANGSVVGRHSSGLFGGGVLDTHLEPGDVVVVPQKILGSSLLWRNLLTTAQLASSIAITAAVAAI